MIPSPISIVLDRPRELRWTMRAQARNSSLARPATFAMIGKRRHSLYAISALIWAALVDRDHEFELPEDLAEYLATPEQQTAALKAITAMLQEAYPEKKTQNIENTSKSGHDASSKLESGPVPSTIGS